MDPARESDVREIESAIREALSLHGVAGVVVIRGRNVEIQSSGAAPVAIEIQALVEQWPLLPHDLRQRKMGDIARRLASALRATTSTRPPSMSRGLPRPIFVPVSTVVLLGVIGIVAWFVFRPGGIAGSDSRAGASAIPAGPETPTQALERQARVCDAARRRIYSGASIGPFDTEGWVAELWLAKRRADDLAKSPAVTSIASNTKLLPSADAAIAALPDGAVEIVSGIPDASGRSTSGWGGVTVRFSGRYVGAFLDPEMRPRFLALADRLADGVGADMGALYARCAHLPFHDIGAWFRGSDVGSAASALIYGVGAFAELPAIDHGALMKIGAPSDLDALRTAAAKIDALSLAALIGAQGGNVTKSAAGAAVTITFPLLGGTRAITASRNVARKINVGVGTN